MKTPFDTDAILFGLLDGKTSIKGGCYVGDDRPEDSTDEDIVVNTIDLSQDSLPQIGTSNINIYTKDTSKKINGNSEKREHQRVESHCRKHGHYERTDDETALCEHSH